MDDGWAEWLREMLVNVSSPPVVGAREVLFLSFTEKFEFRRHFRISDPQAPSAQVGARAS